MLWSTSALACMQQIEHQSDRREVNADLGSPPTSLRKKENRKTRACESGLSARKRFRRAGRVCWNYQVEDEKPPPPVRFYRTAGTVNLEFACTTNRSAKDGAQVRLCSSRRDGTDLHVDRDDAGPRSAVLDRCWTAAGLPFLALACCVLPRWHDGPLAIRDTAWGTKDGAPGVIEALATSVDGYLWLGSEGTTVCIDSTGW